MSTRFYIPSFKVIGLLVLKKMFEGFYHIWAWKSSWSSQHHMEAPYEIWFQTIWCFVMKKKNRSRSTQDHHLGKLGSTRVPDAVYQISTISANRFRRKRFLRILPYLGVAAIVTDWSSSFWRDDVWRVWTTDNACLSYKLTDEPSAFTRYNKLYPTWCMKLSVSQSFQG